MDQKTVYIYAMEYYAAEGKKELPPFATAWMGLESIILSEWCPCDILGEMFRLQSILWETLMYPTSHTKASLTFARPCITTFSGGKKKKKEEFCKLN